MDLPVTRTYIRGALYGGGIAALLLVGIGLAVGLASGAESRLLLESSLPTIRFLASGVMTASATTLALLLTLLSLSGNIESSLESDFYRRLQRIALLDVIAFVGGIVLLLALVLPLGDENNFSGTFYTVAYYTFTILAAISAGLLVSVVFAIYGAVDDLIQTCWLGDDDGPLAIEEPDEE